MYKTCNKCGQEKLLENFSKGRCKDGLKNSCKPCDKEYNRARTEKIKNSNKDIPTKIVCTNCKYSKSINEFDKNICSSTGYQLVCKQCRKIYRSLNSKKILEDGKKWRENNKKYKAEKDKEYRINNKEKINSTKRDYEKNKRETNSLFKLSSNIRRTMLLCFKNKNFGKNSSTLNILGCTFEEFKQHIESQFLNWMSWENYGDACETLDYNCSWDLDHIIPISSAKTEDEVYMLNHWSNFQPLCSKINRWEKKNIIYPVYNLELNIEK